MGDEEIYLLATNEVEGTQKNQALWAKVLTLTEGDLEKAKYQYIRLRVPQLAKEYKSVKPSPMTLSFVYDYNVNTQINEIYRLVYEGKTDREIAEIFTKQRVINLGRNDYIWTDEEIASIRRDFRLDTSTPLVITSPQQADVEGPLEFLELSNSFAKLIDGNFGLAKSFWVFGVLVPFVGNILVSIVISSSGKAEYPGVIAVYWLVFMVFSTFYELVAIISVWQAANKYRGPRLWAILAKSVMVLWGIMLPFMWLVVILTIRNL